jgi:ribosomal protein L29
MKKITILKKELRNTNTSIEALTYELNQLKTKLNRLRTRQLTLQTRINKGQNKDIHITDHAIVQYLVRYKNFSKKEIEDFLITRTFLDIYEVLPNDGEFPNGNGQTLVIKNGKIVTVI